MYDNSLWNNYFWRKALPLSWGQKLKQTFIYNHMVYKHISMTNSSLSSVLDFGDVIVKRKSSAYI